MSSTPGWYPDPAGTPGRFRYWDGRAWSATTTTDPSQPPPAAATTPSQPADQSRRPGRGLLIGIIATALVLVVVVVLGVRALLDQGGPITGPPPPSSTVSAWDETSKPDPTPSASPSPSDPPSPSDEPPPEQVACPQGDPVARNDHPADGRVHGGGLSFPKVSGWEDNPGAGFTWAYDVAAQSDPVEETWVALMAVGALRMADGFENPQASAEAITACLSTSDYYAGFTGATELDSGEVTVDGQPGWRIRTEIRVDDPDVEAEGDVLDVVVVDTGAGESLGMFVGAVPLDDDSRLTVLDETEAALAVD